MKENQTKNATAKTMTRKTPTQRLLETYPLEQQEKFFKSMEALGMSDSDLVVDCVNKLLNMLDAGESYQKAIFRSMAETTSDISFEAGFLTALKLFEQHLKANSSSPELVIELVENQSRESNLQLIKSINQLQARMREL